MQPHGVLSQPHASTNCASSSAATSPTTSSACRSTRRPSTAPPATSASRATSRRAAPRIAGSSSTTSATRSSAHDMKFGVDYSRIRATSYFNNNTGGTFTFATDRPFDANDLTTYPTQYTQNIGDPNLRRPNDVYRPVRAGQLARAAEFHVELRRALRPRERVQGSDRRRGRVASTSRHASGLRGIRSTIRRRSSAAAAGCTTARCSSTSPATSCWRARFVGVTIVNPGFPDPYSRGSVAPPSAPSTTVAPDEVNTPVTRQLSLGVKRELFAGIAVSVDFVNTRGRNLYNAPDVNAPDPITGLRPNPAFLRIVEYQSTGNSWYNAPAGRPRAPHADAGRRSACPTRCRSRRATSRTSASRRRTTTTARPRRGRPATIAAISS